MTNEQRVEAARVAMEAVRGILPEMADERNLAEMAARLTGLDVNATTLVLEAMEHADRKVDTANKLILHLLLGAWLGRQFALKEISEGKATNSKVATSEVV